MSHGQHDSWPLPSSPQPISARSLLEADVDHGRKDMRVDLLQHRFHGRRGLLPVQIRQGDDPCSLGLRDTLPRQTTRHAAAPAGFQHARRSLSTPLPEPPYNSLVEGVAYRRLQRERGDEAADRMRAGCFPTLRALQRPGRAVPHRPVVQRVAQRRLQRVDCEKPVDCALLGSPASQRALEHARCAILCFCRATQRRSSPERAKLRNR